MAEPGNEMAAGAGGQGRLRASHADRDQVIDRLKAAFVQGRLSQDEFGLRVGRALASRTYADLAALTADIPAQLTRAQQPVPAGGSVNKKKKTVAALACATLAIPGTIAGLPPIPDGSPFAVPVIVVLFVLCMVVSTGWLVLFHAWLDKRADRPSPQGLPPGAGGAAYHRPAPADPARQLPQSGNDLRDTAKAVQSRFPRPQMPGMWAPPRGNRSRRRYALGCSSR